MTLALLGGLWGCASSRPPALDEYQATLHLGRSVRLDERPFRYEVVAGDHAVLELRATRGKSLWRRDSAATWEILIEFTDPAQPGERRVLAVVAGEDVVYLARQAHGALRLDGDGDPRRGQMDLTFEPERDLGKIGALHLAGTFSARVVR